MSTSIKIKLDQIYKVDAASESTPEHYTPATIEIYSAGSNVTIRATSNPDFTGDYDELPVITDEAAEGEVWQSDLVRSVRYLSVSCSDADAEIYVAGFDLKEVPYYEVASATISDIDDSIVPGLQMQVSEESICPALLKVVSRADGALQTVEVSEAGTFDSDPADTYDVVDSASGVGGTVTVTSSSTTTYSVATAASVAAGTGYAADDELTLAGTEDAVIKVLTVDEETGEILTFDLVAGGVFDSDPAGEGVSFTGGTGTGATFDITSSETTIYSIDTAELETAGSGYESEFTMTLPGTTDAELSFTAENVAELAVIRGGEYSEDITGEVTIAGLATTATVTVTTNALYE